MTESNEKKPSLARRGWRIVQWLIALPLLLIALMFAFGSDGLSAPGAPVTAYYVAVVLFALTALSLAPPIFFRLPKFAKIGSYVGLIVAFVFLGTMLGQIQDAYSRTPEGAKVAAQREIERKAQEEADRLEADRLGEAQAIAEQAANNAALEDKVAAEMDTLEGQLEDCLSVFGGVSDLKESVKQSLHNPDAFEHVETSFLPIAEGNTTMIFRAENGFGAIRKGSVTATVDPDTCKATSIRGLTDD